MVIKKKGYTVSYSNYQTADLDDYYIDFASIWNRDYKERSAFDLWLHIVDHASRVARAIRKQQPHAVIDDIADTTVWLFSFLSHCSNSKNPIDASFKIEIQPSEIIWMKYPGLCPSCFDFWFIEEYSSGQSIDLLDHLDITDSRIDTIIKYKSDKYIKPEACTCLSRRSNFKKQKAAISRNRAELDQVREQYARALSTAGKKIASIGNIQEMFSSIYSNIYDVLTLDTIAFHLLEEVGEATQALKDLYTYDDSREPFTPKLHEVRKARLFEELADVFSWLFTLALKIDSTYVKQAFQYHETIAKGHNSQAKSLSLSFANILWAKYGRAESGGNWDSLKCPGCQSAPCECDRDLKIDWSLAVHSDDKEKHPNNEEYEMDTKNLIFISYSRDDSKWLERLNRMLKPLVRNNKIFTWSDKDIGVGQLWKNEIDSALSRTKIAVLLVSDHFLASDFIAENELPPLLKGAEEKGTKIVWIPISACLYGETPIGGYQAACDPEKPLDGMSESEYKIVLADICKDLKRLAS